MLMFKIKLCFRTEDGLIWETFAMWYAGRNEEAALKVAMKSRESTDHYYREFISYQIIEHEYLIGTETYYNL